MASAGAARRTGRPHHYRAIRQSGGVAVNRYTGQARPPQAGRRALSTGLCIFLLAAGGIFWLALPGGSHLGINLHIVGIIVICAGLLGLTLPLLPGAPAQADRLRRWVIPSGTEGTFPGSYSDEQPMVADLSAEPGRPTLADDLLDAEKDPPL